MDAKHSSILITGSTGFIGNKTKTTLEDQGHEVIAFVGDITNASDWEDYLHGGEVLMLIAGVRTETDKDFEVNAKSIDTLFETALRVEKLPKRVILASSQAVYMGNKTPFKETDIPVPTTIYGKSKLLGEEKVVAWCQSLHVPFVILRYSTVLGDGVREQSRMSGPLFAWTSAAKEGVPIKVFQDGNQTRDYIHVDDVARASVLALELPSGTYNVGGGRPIKVKQLAQWIKEAVKSNSEVTIVGNHSSENDPREMLSDISKLKALGWKPQKTSRKAVEEFIAHSKTISFS
jgi:UDP-glucose 4-epimerase